MCVRVCVYAYTYPLEDGLYHMLKLTAVGIYISSTKNSRNTNFVSEKKYLGLLGSLKDNKDRNIVSFSVF